jgi:hypothetical protein
MKKAILAIVSVIVSAGLMAQDGTINNSSTPSSIGGANEPITLADGTALAGDMGMVQLYVGADLSSVAPVGAPIGFLAGGGAGFFRDAATLVVGLPAGSDAVILPRAWEGQAASYEAALAAGAATGEGVSFTITLGGAGSPPSLPANLVGFTGFALSGTPVIPEPTTLALAFMGIGALLLRRRR